MAGLDLEALGIPQMDAYARQYLARRGLSGSFDPFYIAFSFFKLAIIFEGVVQRAVQGGRGQTPEIERQSALSKALARHGLTMTGL